jgi:Ca2+-binding RTX toxin-like protein
MHSHSGLEHRWDSGSRYGTPYNENPYIVTGNAIETTYLPSSATFSPANASSTGTTVSAAPNGATITVSGSNALVTSGGITFNLEFDAAAMAAPQSFRDGIEQAASLLSAAISDKITVNIQIDYSGTGGGAAAGPDSGRYVSYSTIRSDLIAGATPGDTVFNSLPSGSSIQGQTNVAVWNAELKALGLMNPNDTTTDDGSATFATDIDRSLLVGVALHELTHAMGRVPFGPAPDIFDLFRFTNSTNRLFSGSIPAPAAYFSIDGGYTKLADYGRNSDPSDFLNSGSQGTNDPFNEYYFNGTVQTLTTADLKQMDVLGFHIGSGTPSPPPPTALPDLSVNALSVTATAVSFTLLDGGTASAGTSTSSLYLSTDSTITKSDTLLGTFSSPSLQTGGSVNETIALSLPGNMTPGTYFLGVMADSTSAVTESNNASAAVPVIIGNGSANSLKGTGGNDIIFGMAGNDTISGGAGNDIIVGGNGNDTLIGGTGNDQFVFKATNEGLDQIYNFHAGDLIDFAASAFGSHLAVGGAANGTLDPSHFIANATGPTNSAQEFWFNTTNHTLYFDSNGSAPGGQVAIAHLMNTYVLHSTDILIV